MAPRHTQSVPQAPHVATPRHVDTNERKAHLARLATPPLTNSQDSSSWSIPALVHVCMYCSVVMDSTPQYCLLHEPPDTTHGACDRCYRRLLRELKQGIASPLLDLIRVRRLHVFGVPFDPYLATQAETSQAQP